MPENYYCLDNFFYKMTDLESPRKNNDCYFYYYSTCTKGDNCTFRHEPSALGCETTCSFWKEGKCINVHCNFRHMELRKNRKSIPCYWESQPGGCKKPHCPFLHTSPKSIADDGEPSDLKTTDNKESDICNKKTNQVDNNFGSPVVDPLVVNFEEESDNESAPTQSPIKTRVVKVKTLEEIKLERIQAESAAYYSYPETERLFQKELGGAESLRNRIIKRLNNKSPKNEVQNIEVLSLEEIRKRKKRDIALEEPNAKKQKGTINLSEKSSDDIKAGRAKRFGIQLKRRLSEPSEESSKKIKLVSEVSTSEAEVSSTSKIDELTRVQCVVSPIPRKDVIEISTPDEISTNVTKSPCSDKELSDGDVLSCDSDSKLRLDSSKIDDLLLEEDDVETSTLSLKAEEDILKDIDNLLNE